MTEHVEKLRATLGQLHAELAQIDTLDEETRTVLLDMADEIRAALHQKNDGDGGESEEPTLGHRLTEMREEFQQSHPALAQLLGNVADALARLGI